VRVWAIDASSIIDLRQIPGKQDGSREAVFAALSALVEQGRLFFPPQVFDEVLRFGATVAQEWAKANEVKATKYKPVYADIKSVLEKVPRLIDPSKPAGTDQADPYVIVTAQRLAADGHTPTIITEDRKKQQGKIPLSSAAGVFGFPSVALYVFLETEGITGPLAP
jgi:uncharacterized protein DUF4411